MFTKGVNYNQEAFPLEVRYLAVVPDRTTDMRHAHTHAELQTSLTYLSGVAQSNPIVDEAVLVQA